MAGAINQYFASFLKIACVIAEQIARAGAGAGRAVVRVVERAMVERKAAAADAAVELIAGLAEQGDPLVELAAHMLADPAPVLAVWGAAIRQRGQLGLDLCQGEAELLGDQREGEASDIGAQKAPLVATRAHGGDQ